MATCECGCGAETPRYKSSGRRGIVKGQPMRFIPGHQGYLTSWTPERKAAWSQKRSGQRIPDAQRQKISATLRARRERTTGYRTIYAPSHPRAIMGRWMYEHIVVAEKKLGRLLVSGEVVHHIDGDKTNNHPENLQVLPSHEAHAALHHAEDPSRRAMPINAKTGRYMKKPAHS